jgi:heme exporter protein A
MLSEISLKDISLIRRGRCLFSKLSLQLNSGDILWVKGANGAGKTSLLRVIAGLLPPSAGTVSVKGRIALADLRPSLDKDISLAKALAQWGVRELSPFHMQELAGVPLSMLSSGQNQRAQLLRLISSRAEIWLLDEPTTALDSKACAELESYFEQHRERGGIIMCASHQPLGLNGLKTLELGQ